MHEAMLYEKLANSRVRCHICQWYCNIGPGKFGVCRMYHNREGVLYNMNYAKASSVAALLKRNPSSISSPVASLSQ